MGVLPYFHDRSIWFKRFVPAHYTYLLVMPNEKKGQKLDLEKSCFYISRKDESPVRFLAQKRK